MLALEDDLNTPEAYAGLHELRDIASQTEGAARGRAIARLRDAGRLMGFFGEEPIEWKKFGVSEKDRQIIDQKVAEYDEARKNKDYSKSDILRVEIVNNFPVSVATTGGVTSWVFKPKSDSDS
jgi:cysteinyl-tRNA synthetase